MGTVAPALPPGRVERYDPKIGIIGWLAAAKDTGSVELVACGQVLATTPTNIIRFDLRNAVPPSHAKEPWVGFRFSPPSIMLAASLSPKQREQPLRVRDASSGRMLPGPVLPTGEMIAAEAELLAGEPKKRVNFDPSPNTPGELVSVLDRLRLDANLLLQSPLPLSEHAHQGTIEILTYVGPGLYLIGGWVQAPVPRYSTALILVDGRKTIAATFAVPYARADLRSGDVAFCGLLKTDANIWRSDQEFVLIFGETDRFMRQRRSRSLLTLTDGLAWLDNAAKISDDDRKVITEVVKRKSAGVSPPETFGCQVGIEVLNLLPGFGAFVRGWVLSPTGDLEIVSVRAGDVIAFAPQDGIATTARPDLAKGFPPLADRIKRAGFAAVCTGPLEPSADCVQVVLRLTDGSEFSVPVKSEKLRIGYSMAALEAVVSAFPAYASEPFFPALSLAFVDSVRSTPPQLNHLRRVTGKRALVFNMPVPGSLARLALVDITRRTNDWTDVAVVILYGPDHDRSAIMVGVKDVMADANIGLIRYDNRADIGRTLTQVLAEIGAESFTFVQQGSRLTELGWRAAYRSLVPGPHDGLQVFVFDDILSRHLAGAVGIGALSWTTEAFEDYVVGAAPAIGTGLIGAGLASVAGAETVRDGVARYHGPQIGARALLLSGEIRESAAKIDSVA